MLNTRFILKTFFLAVIIVYCLFSCANIGQGPQGGPYDFDPPVLISSSPKNNQTNYKENRIVLNFDENINLNSVSQKLIVTPPQKRMPIVIAANKKVYVELRDTLQDNTTYVIDFSDAIEDYNQNNPLENFSISFSTGEVLDSLEVSGRVLMAKDDEPQKGFFVGLHSNLSDTAFTDIPFERISRTNEKGEFIIRGIAPGKYHIFALEDKGREYRYTNLKEAIAFSDVVIEPTTQERIISDTVFTENNKEKIVDSIGTKQVVEFLPNNLTLMAFQSTEQNQYFRNTQRSDAHRFELNFGGLTDPPVLEPLDFDPKPDWVIPERNTYQDTIFMYWIKDEDIIKKDSLMFKMTYHKTDSLFNLQTVTDSILIVNRTRKTDKQDQKKKKTKEDEKPEITYLEFKSNLGGKFEIYDSIKMEFGEPLRSDLKPLLSLEEKNDSIYTPLDFVLEKDSLNPRKYYINYKWNYSQEYRLKFDSAAVYSIYDYSAAKYSQEFTIKSKQDYSNLQLNISGLNSDDPQFIQLLDEKGDPVRQAKVRNMVAIFRNVVPGKYYARLVVDKNGNNKWDSGDYFKNIQPELVYYYPKLIELRAYWDAIETFAIDPLSFDKPKEIMKNKPVEKTEREKLMEKEDSERYRQEQERKKQQDMASGRITNF